MKTYNKKLYKSRDNKVVAGVFGGLGEYFNVDPSIFRVIYSCGAVFTGIVPGVLAYVLMAIVMPIAPEVIHENSQPVS